MNTVSVLSATDRQKSLQAVALLVFLVMGLSGAMGPTLIPAIRIVFGLGLSSAMTVQWIALVVSGLSSLILAQLLHRFGAKAMVLAGLGLMMLGCFQVRLFILSPFGVDARYGLMLASLAVIALGTSVLQVAANLLVVQLGPARTASSRLTLAQSFNSLGVLVGVSLGTNLALNARVTTAPAMTLGIGQAYGWSAAFNGVALVAALMVGASAWSWSRPSVKSDNAQSGNAPIRAALGSGWALAGAGGIALYVGAEGSIGSILISYLHQKSVLNLSLEQAGHYLGWFYWGGALAGRLGGTWLLHRWPPARMLGFAAGGAAIASALAAMGSGPVAGYAALSIGLFNAIMFPVIFSITVERSAAPSAAVSGLLSTAIAGGAILSVLVGWTGEHFGFALCFVIPMLAYGLIALFGTCGSILPSADKAPQDSRITSSVGNLSERT
ncbi:FHS family L-fucose permease-like MFS transporter [Novosphingobium sp. SG751A]|uniref:MFS transporter n=1 Tax=Novosphingobium sp. SG751A TaxID=2587000 RepID=UPI001552160C|nr:MFS transporter [Novosphingobium sp. SG751A]NOW45311.1 FHS family L-fucose permease-like MFS transporter [Novosphingobium sp. SG751A]